jgi:hypothetical protein
MEESAVTDTHLQVIQAAMATTGMDNPERHAALQELLDLDFVVIEPDGLRDAGTSHGPDGWWTVVQQILSRR